MWPNLPFYYNSRYKKENPNPGNSNPDNTIVVENELQYEDVNEGQWVIVVYEGVNEGQWVIVVYEGVNEGQWVIVVYEGVNEGQWVIVVYEGETFAAKITEKRNKMFAVRCLEKPLGIGTPQDLEKETDVVFYDRVYQANVQPSLVKVNRGWKWAY